MFPAGLPHPHRDRHLRTPLQFEPYVYQPLPTPSSIRLLSFVKPQDRIGAISFDGQPLIECVLSTVDFGCDLEFKALSYTWGNWESKHQGQYNGYVPSVKWPIIVNGRLLYITRNLHEALWQFGPFGDWNLDRRHAPYYKTDLMRAAESGQALIIESLIHKGASLHLKDNYGQTAIHHAAQNGHLSAVIVLLKYGAATDETDNQGRTPLDCCLWLQRGKWETVAEMLRNYFEPVYAFNRDVTPVLPSHTSLWVDAICINQGDLEERSTQVGMMASIYGSARSGLIWLGVADHNAKHVWEVLTYDLIETDRCQHTNLTLTQHYRQMVESFRSFFDRLWFSRTWVIQEIALPKKVEVYCGSYEFDWSKLSYFVLNIMRKAHCPTLDHPLYIGSLKYFGENNSAFSAYTVAHIRNRTQTHLWQNDSRSKRSLQSSSSSSVIQKFSLPVLLIFSWRFGTTDPRDRIYGLLGVAAALEGSSPITPDYSKPLPDLFTQVGKIFVQAPGFHKMCRRSGGHEDFEPLEGLSFVQGSGCVKHRFNPLESSCCHASFSSQIPSWVPDFSGQMSTGRIHHDQLDATAMKKPVFYPTKQKLLKVDGCWIDSVAVVEDNPIQTQRHFRARFRSCEGFSGCSIRHFEPSSWLGMMSEFNVLYHTGQNRAEVLWRTLVADRISGDPSFSRKSFKQFLCEDFAKHKPRDCKRYMRMLADLHASDDSDSIPSPAEIDQFCQAYNPRPGDELTGPLHDDKTFHFNFAQLVRKRGLFRTKNEYLGFGPLWARPGDELWLIAGARTPFILRRFPTYSGMDCYRLIGEAYVHGVMRGELLQNQDLQFGPVTIC